MKWRTAFISLACLVTLLVAIDLGLLSRLHFPFLRHPESPLLSRVHFKNSTVNKGREAKASIICVHNHVKNDGNNCVHDRKNNFNSTSNNETSVNIACKQCAGNQRQASTSAGAIVFPMFASHITSKIWPAYNRTKVDAKSLQVKTILFHNIPYWIKAIGDEYFKNCDIKACLLTTNRSQRHTADAVIYHLPWLYDPRPPPTRPRGQIWIAYGLESPVRHRGQHKNIEWRDVFNWTITYRQDSDLFHPYGMLIPNTPKVKNYTQIALQKTRSVAWFVSHCHTQSKREKYVKRMQTRISVDIFGKCGSQQCVDKCDELLDKTYKFYLSFENSICHDYITEKLFKIYGNVDVVPVVRGGADYKKNFPPGTFIDASDFSGPESLAAFLVNLEKDIAAYATFLSNKDQYRTRSVSVWCKLCEMLHFEKKVKWYQDFPAWLINGMCKRPRDL